MVVFSIVFPVYNVENYIGDCLKSLLSQSYPYFEIIAINDGSTDGSLFILESFAKIDSRVKVFSQNNIGLSATRNRGISLAVGHYIIFIDSDDLVSVNLLKYCVDSFINYNSDLVVFDHAEFKDETFDLVYDPKQLESGSMTTVEYLHKIQKISTAAWIPSCYYAFNLAFIRKVGIKFYEGIFHEDNLFTPLVLYYAVNISIIPKVLYFHRRRADSITTNPKNLEKAIQDQFFIAEYLYDFSNSIKNRDRKNLILLITAKRYRILIDRCKNNMKFLNNELYLKILISYNNKKILQRIYFKYKFIESIQEFHYFFFKWPILIYKYKVKPIFQ